MRDTHDDTIEVPTICSLNCSSEGFNSHVVSSETEGVGNPNSMSFQQCLNGLSLPSLVELSQICVLGYFYLKLLYILALFHYSFS